MTIYESVFESSSENARAAAQADADGDSKMEGEGQEGQLELKFRELPYTVETGEAEMIGVDYVARNPGNATAIDSAARDTSRNQASQTPVGTLDPKKVGKAEAKAVDDPSLLSPEDDECKSCSARKFNGG